MAELEPVGLEDAEPRMPELSEFRACVDMPAKSALEILRRGEMLKNVRVVRLCLEGEFPLPVRMRGVVLVQPEFDRASFQDEVALVHCTLDRPRFRRDTVFAKGLDLRESILIKAQLTNIAVQGTLACDSMQTRGKLLLANSRFEGTVRLWEARFKGWVDFSRCEFLGQADFRSFHAEEGFSLNKCRFADDALFRGATVAKKWDGTTSRFEGLLDFSKAKLHDYVYLESIEQSDRQRFAFLNTLGEKILISTEQLEGRLLSETKKDYKSAMHEYAYLKRAFGALHRYEQEDWAFYRFKVNERRTCGRSWLRPLTKVGQFCSWLFLDLGCGYGTSPRRAVRAALAIILGFGLIYGLGVTNFGDAKPPLGEPRDSLANRLIFGVMTSVAVFTSGFGSLKELAQGWLMFPLIVEALLGTLLWGLFIVAFSRKVIR
jgi:hypothetical protein